MEFNKKYENLFMYMKLISEKNYLDKNVLNLNALSRFLVVQTCLS